MGVFTSCLTRVFPQKGGIAAHILPLNFGLGYVVNDLGSQAQKYESGLERCGPSYLMGSPGPQWSLSSAALALKPWPYLRLWPFVALALFAALALRGLSLPLRLWPCGICGLSLPLRLWPLAASAYPCGFGPWRP